jgi:alternate signal-mediated exported protein
MKRIGTLLLCAAAAVFGVGAASLASWSVTGAAPADSALVFGTLNLRSEELAGSTAGPVWMDASVTGQPRPIDPETFLASAGDTLRMGHLFTLEAGGDNLEHELRVDWALPAALPAGVTAEYTLTEDPMDPPGTTHVYRAPLGTAVSLPATGSGDRSFLLDVVLTYAGDRADPSFEDAGSAGIGTIVVSATQRRDGVGG